MAVCDLFNSRNFIGAAPKENIIEAAICTERADIAVDEAVDTLPLSQCQKEPAPCRTYAANRKMFCLNVRSLTPGKLLISLELLPKDAADAQPVGSGRNEPNQNPYLPPPAGRMKFSFNPFRLSMSLLGPKACYKVGCRLEWPICFIIPLVCVLAYAFDLDF